MREPRLYSVGRSHTCDFKIDHDSVSPKQAEFFIDPESNVFLTDLNSHIGTFVNARRIFEPVLLNTGDRITFGDQINFDWEHELLGKTPQRSRQHESQNHVKDPMSFFLRNKDVILIYLIDLILILILFLLLD